MVRFGKCRCCKRKFMVYFGIIEMHTPPLSMLTGSRLCDGSLKLPVKEA